MFRTQYDRERVFSPSGNSEVNVYSARYDSDGHLIVHVSGKRDIYPEIQASALSCDINYLVSRFASGDATALSKIQGTYGDFTQFPKSYAELLNQVNRGTELFDSLPADVRAKFDNSLGVFLQSAGSQDWMDKLGISKPAAAKPAAAESAAAEPAAAESAAANS